MRKTAITECRWVGEQVLARSPDEARDACRAIDIVKARHDQAWSRSRIDHTARKPELWQRDERALLIGGRAQLS